MCRLRFVLVSFLLTASLCLGQTGTSTIRGTVSDPQGRVISGATLTLTNTQTNSVRTTRSTESGAYVLT
jgi:Carboxypeptidase regulatory-like domain